MWRRQTGAAERMGSDVCRSALAALHILVDRWRAPWAQRRFMGERLGVWVLAVLWLSLTTALAVFLFY
jgi:hypothetical protein